jgi:hypothetical protein
MKIHKKNMVCQGTEYCVQLELMKLGIRYSKFKSGEIEFEKELSSSEMKSLYDSLRQYGLELLK